MTEVGTVDRVSNSANQNDGLDSALVLHFNHEPYKRAAASTPYLENFHCVVSINSVANISHATDFIARISNDHLLAQNPTSKVTVPSAFEVVGTFAHIYCASTDYNFENSLGPICGETFFTVLHLKAVVAFVMDFIYFINDPTLMAIILV